uniref:RecQ_Zn_bind domain-containing protein n=1 Tax=Strongyloides venezuelensis TaxID=75913 RepID=A0A0K0G5X0_STRVS
MLKQIENGRKKYQASMKDLASESFIILSIGKKEKIFSHIFQRYKTKCHAYAGNPCESCNFRDILSRKNFQCIFGARRVLEKRAKLFNQSKHMKKKCTYVDTVKKQKYRNMRSLIDKIGKSHYDEKLQYIHYSEDESFIMIVSDKMLDIFCSSDKLVINETFESCPNEFN